MPPVIFRFLNDLSSVQTVKQGKNINEAKRVLIETVIQVSTRCWSQGYFAFTCFASHYFFSSYFSSNYKTLNTSGFIDDIRQALGNYRQQLNEHTNTFMRSCVKGIELLVGQPFSLEKIPGAGKQSIKLTAKYLKSCQQDSGISVKFRPCSNIPANIRTDIRNTMKKAGYHPNEEGMCYGLAWAALLACVRQDGQAYMQRMQYLAQMDNPPLPGTLDTHRIYPFFDAVTLSMTNYKNMSGYKKGIGYPGRQEITFPGRVIGGHESDYQVPVVKQTFIAECTPETFIRFLQQTRTNNNGIPFGVMIHYPDHATSIGFDGSKWLATAHDNHYYTETTERLYSFFDEQSNHYKDGRIIAAMEIVTGNEYTLNTTNDTLVVNAKKSVSAPLALHLALQYGDANVTTDSITIIGQQAHTPEILLERLACKDARGTPGLYMALQKGHADATTAFMQASTGVITVLPCTEVQKAELLYRLFSSKNACLHFGTQAQPQENTGDRDASRKRTPPGQTDSEAKRSKANSQTHPQETSSNSIASRKRTPYGQTGAKAKRSKCLAVKEKQGTNLQTGTAAQGSRPENTEPGVQGAIDISAGLSALQKYLTPGMNDKESEAVKKLFRVLNSKKIRIKETFHKLLANNVERKDLTSFCAKASVFFGALADTIKDTGCLTSMLMKGKKYSQSFAAREDAGLEYLARLDSLRCFSSMNTRKGLPEKEVVEEILGWELWKPEGVFSMELFRAFSSMNHGKGLPKKEAVKAVLDWELWKPEGVFSMELFRAFLSMNHGKGLPKKEAVKAVLDWELWKPEGVFSMELFRAFSSMNHGKGLPKKEAVKAVLDWELWKPEGVFSMELFRAFSSMNAKQGLPKKEEVEAVLDWELWKPEGVFSMKLFRAFSSMNNGKGLPKKKEVEAVLGWEVWKTDGAFNLELFRAFSSMNSGKGLPKKGALETVLDWDVWKPEGVFSMELFRAFSSMNNGKGMPKKEAVEAMLDWKIWKPEGVFSMELFRAFSSMNNGKGLPQKEAVEAILNWDVWKPEGVFSMELFRAFSSMNHSKGLLQKEAVKAILNWDVWKPEGVFSMELFRAFSSMNSSKGLPTKEAVEFVLGWELWKLDGVFSMELFRAFSSMNTKQGLPTKEAVEAFLDWQVWKPEGVFNLELLRAFSSMNHGKGLPKKEAVEAVLDWVKGEEERDVSLFKLVVRLYASEGIPDIKKLKQYEQKLLNLFFAYSTKPESDDEAGNKDKYCRLTQPAALFLSTRKPQYVLNFMDVECFYQQATGTPARKLENLLKLLLSYGGQGVARYLTLNDNDKKALLDLSSLRTPLPLTMQAIIEFSPQERKLYLFFTRNLKNPPDKDQWSSLNLKLNSLANVLKTRNNQKRYLEVIWNLPLSDRNTFLDVTHAAHVTAVFPSLSALHKLAKGYSQQKLKALLTACPRFKQGTPSGEEIKRLFIALLETRLPLYYHGNIPKHFLSGYTETEDAATFVPTPPTRTTEKLALYFVAAVTRVLINMLYHYEASRLKIEQYGGEIHFFPVPELEIQAKGIKISNWPMEVFQRFLVVTEFPEQYYLSQEEWLQYSSEFPLCFRGSTVTCHQEERAATGDTDFQPFSIAMLTGLLKNNIPVKPAAWKSFDYHKDKLPRAVHRQLLGEIEKATHEDIPISLIEYLKAKKAAEELRDKTLPQNRLNISTNPLPATVEETLGKEEQFQGLWGNLSRKTLLEDADLQLLTSYKEYMTMEHIVKILQSTHASIAPCKLVPLRQLLGEKRDLHSRKDPFLLTLGDEVTSYLMEAEI